MAEVINQIAFQVIGNDNTICLASETGQFELNVMEPVLAFNLLQSIDIMNSLEYLQKNVSRESLPMKNRWRLTSIHRWCYYSAYASYRLQKHQQSREKQCQLVSRFVAYA